MDANAWGTAGIGFVFGYLLYYAVRHTERFDINGLSIAIGAIGSEVVIALVDEKKGGGGLGTYGIGLFAGFVFYLLLALFLIWRGKFDEVASRRLLLRAATGVSTSGSPSGDH